MARESTRSWKAGTRKRRKWSGDVMKRSNALDLEPGVFTQENPRRIASALKRSAMRSKRRKGTPYQSAMSMLNFHINRGGKGLSATQKARLERAKGDCARYSVGLNGKGENVMPEQGTIRRAERKKRQGKAASTQAGEFVKEELHHIREGKHGARSTKQAIAIGLSKARRAGVDLKPPRKGQTSERTRRSAERAYKKGQRGSPHKPAPRRSRATLRALK
jgi:hypothetical protein